MRRPSANRQQPGGNVIGQVSRGVLMIRPIAFARVARIKRERAKSRPKMPLGPAKGPVVTPHTTKEDQRVTFLTHFLVVKRATFDDNLGHERDR
jgi:hypothetical protein